MHNASSLAKRARRRQRDESRSAERSDRGDRQCAAARQATTSADARSPAPGASGSSSARQTRFRSSGDSRSVRHDHPCHAWVSLKPLRCAVLVSLRVAAITVTYRGGDSSRAWAAALSESLSHVRSGAVELTVIAVDNASGDGTAAALRKVAPWVEVLDMPRNAGFAAGCNAGIRHAGNVDLIALINPDVRVHESFLASLATFDWPAEVAARGPLVLTPDGSIEQSARGFPRLATAIFGRTSLLARLLPGIAVVRHGLRARPAAGPLDVDWVSGACIVMPRDRFERVGPLDEGYFMYWEDADWCRRAHEAGLRIVYDPRIVVTHHQGSSSRSRPIATTVAFHRSALRYWRIHAARSSVSVVAAAVLLTVRCSLKLIAAGVATLARRGSTSRIRAR